MAAGLEHDDGQNIVAGYQNSHANHGCGEVTFPIGQTLEGIGKNRHTDISEIGTEGRLRHCGVRSVRELQSDGNQPASHGRKKCRTENCANNPGNLRPRIPRDRHRAKKRRRQRDIKSEPVQLPHENRSGKPHTGENDAQNDQQENRRENVKNAHTIFGSEAGLERLPPSRASPIRNITRTPRISTSS